MKTIGISETVDSLMVVTHDPRDLGVVLDFGKNPLANGCMIFHESALLERESTRLF